MSASALLLREPIQRVGWNPDIGVRPLDAVAPFFHLRSSKEPRVEQSLMTGRPQIFADIHSAAIAAYPMDSQGGWRQGLDSGYLEFQRSFSGFSLFHSAEIAAL